MPTAASPHPRCLRRWNRRCSIPAKGSAIPIPTTPELGETLTDIVQVLIAQRGGANGGAQDSAKIRFSGTEGFRSWTIRVALGRRRRRSRKVRDVLHSRPRRLFLFHRARRISRRFSEVGVVDGKHLTFTIDNETYDCTANARILVHADRGQLWLYHDPNYKPRGNWTKCGPVEFAGGVFHRGIRFVAVVGAVAFHEFIESLPSLAGSLP